MGRKPPPCAASSFSARMAVEGAAEDQVRERQRGLGRLAEGVAEEMRAEPGAEAAPPRVDEDHRAEVGGGRPNRVELRVGELAAVDVGGDADALEAELADGALEFADGDGRVLERKGAETVQPAPALRAVRGDGLVDHGREFDRQLRLGPVPVHRHRAHELDVHADRVQVGQPPVHVGELRPDAPDLRLVGGDAGLGEGGPLGRRVGGLARLAVGERVCLGDEQVPVRVDDRPGRPGGPPGTESSGHRVRPARRRESRGSSSWFWRRPPRCAAPAPSPSGPGASSYGPRDRRGPSGGP